MKKHALNLRSIAYEAAPEGTNKSSFYIRLTNVFNGAHGAMTEQELKAVKKTIQKEGTKATAHIDKMIKNKKEAAV